MSKLDQMIKVVRKTDSETVYQLNPRLQLKVVQHSGYCKVYYRVLKAFPWLSPPKYDKYTFVAVTSSNELTNIFDEIDQLEIMSLQEFDMVKKEFVCERSGMTFSNLLLEVGYIDMQFKVMKMFDKQTDIEAWICGGHPYLRVTSLNGNEVHAKLTLYKPLSFSELIE